MSSSVSSSASGLRVSTPSKGADVKAPEPEKKAAPAPSAAQPKATGAAPQDSFTQAPSKPPVALSTPPTPALPSSGAAPRPASWSDNVHATAAHRKGWSDWTSALPQVMTDSCATNLVTNLGANGATPLRESIGTLLDTPGSEGRDAFYNFAGGLYTRFGIQAAGGTEPAVMSQMLAQVGISAEDSRTVDEARGEPAWLREQMRQGDPVAALLDGAVLNGASPGEASPHWVALVGTTKQGDFIYYDPAEGGLRQVPPERLQAALDAQQAQDGSGGLVSLALTGAQPAPSLGPLRGSTARPSADERLRDSTEEFSRLGRGRGGDKNDLTGEM